MLILDFVLVRSEKTGIGTRSRVCGIRPELLRHYYVDRIIQRIQSRRIPFHPHGEGYCTDLD